MGMPLVFEEVHASSDKKKVNEEYFVLANAGASAVSTAGLQVIVNRAGKRGSVMGQIDPGFVLQPGERILILSGIPGKQSQGQPPTREGMRTYYLFQREGLLRGNGTTLRFAINQVDIARVTYDRNAPNGVAKPEG
jgi:hypothetical protein